jgi:putative Ca2+/H+ antiporter (TMEM165/GDT1 family)
MRTLMGMSRDRLGGALLILIGAGLCAGAVSLNIGTLTEMGSGFIPLVLGVLMIVVGIAVLATENREDREQGEVALPQWRGWLCILGSIAAFVIVGEHGGLIPATFVSVLIAALGDKHNRLRDCIVLALVVTVFGVVVFGYGLGLQMPLLAWS